MTTSQLSFEGCSGVNQSLWGLGLALVMALAAASACGVEPNDAFRPLFDGRSLAGWKAPDSSYWTVEEGAITGRITREHPCAINRYLVWDGGELADFELKLRSRLNGEGGINNGFQFRSRLLPDHDVCGYQVDNNLLTPWLVRLYDEYGRHTMAMRGERAAYDSSGVRSSEQILNSDAAWFRLEDWHEYHLTCVGPRITLRVDGRVAAEVEDNDPRRQELQGVLALQLHSGPPTVVQFKDIQLKILKPAAKHFPPEPSPNGRHRTQILGGALAYWPLDTGGHGARPTLRHFPAWDRFELNVKADGAGARAGATVALLDGAYFGADPQLHLGGAHATIFLRARDPRGVWDATLVSKRGGVDRAGIGLFGAELPGTVGPDIALEIQTTKGNVRVSFPVSKTNAKAWLDIVGRYDTESLALFCDGRLMASAPCSGTLVTNDGPFLIGADSEGGKIVRHFRGELEEAALWTRA